MEKYHFHNQGGKYIIQRNGFIPKKTAPFQRYYFYSSPERGWRGEYKEGSRHHTLQTVSTQAPARLPLVKTASTPPGETLLQPL